MSEYPKEWHEAARSVLNRHDGSWGRTNAQADNVLAAVAPLIRAAAFREAADRLEADYSEDPAARYLRRWADEVTDGA